MKITLFGMMMGVETPIPPIMMNAAAPEGAPPRRINDLKDKYRKHSCPAVPRRGPEAGSIVTPDHVTDFHSMGANPICS